ncbi:gamma-butyrobetaine hydroxylase-like domain-containing protein [Roseospirillum parvum]|uniref:DUF971 family protein n=1 Tax=Roseospirillum parvum TaxID=83401 RepID=A0A1G8FM53_9PROT|nr:DUF971 domain-containing protein [Roseospirillum parvum]SDH83198.1 DUF971 family protein [Roseospirillum parvum]
MSAPGAATGTPRPTGLHLDRQARQLSVTFDDGASFDLPAELLRVESPSAEVQGHGPDEKVLVAGKRNVGFIDIEPVGRYAVRLIFDDGHDTGLFTWEILYRLGRHREAIFEAYLKALEEHGLSRDPG